MRLLKPDPALEDVRLAAPRGTQGSAFLTYRRLRPVARRHSQPRFQATSAPEEIATAAAPAAPTSARCCLRIPAAAASSSNHLQPYRRLRHASPSRPSPVAHPFAILQPATRSRAASSLPTTVGCCLPTPHPPRAEPQQARPPDLPVTPGPPSRLSLVERFRVR